MDIYSRFLYQKDLYKKNPPRVVATAFPINNGQVSVYQTDGIDETAIWNLARELNPNPVRRVHGRGELTRESIESVELEVEVEGIHPLHRNIIGWPSSEPEALSKAQLLATKATLVLC
jgi:hypothetical protein